MTSEGVERRAAGYATRTGNDHPNTGHPGNGQEGHAGKRLGPFLCWAIVFADIGTSVYYVPGILYGQVGHLAGLFVTLTLLVFLLLTLKYAEATVRFPEGGGEVTVATRGLSPWAGALGGMFILIDYFLTAAISSLSGLHYFALLVPRLAPYVLLITVLVVVGLGVLNWWGIQESAMVSAVIASIAFVSDLVIVLMVLLHVPLSEIVSIFGEIFSGGHITGLTVLTGFAGAFLAFSGLESIAQLAPVMRVPRRKVVGAALGVVVLTVGISGPLLTIFSTVLLTDPRFHSTMTSPGYAVQAEPTQFISLLAGAYGGTVLAVATAITASALLIFASNTAIIGAYHVMLALARLRYFPRLVTRTDAFRRTPYFAIALVTAIPIIVLLAVRGNIDLLGELYGFGLLGAFSLMCISMDVIRWRERRGERYIGAEVDPELRWVMPASTLPSAGQPPSASLHSAQQPTRTQQTPGPVKHNGRYQYARHDGHHVPTGHLSHWESDGPQAGEQPTSPIQGAARAVAMGATWWSLVATARRSARRIVTAMAARRAAVGERLRSALLPLQTPIQAVWPQITYYLGFLTTALVLVAWLTNLVGKPLATTFGGGLTLLGLAVAVLHYRYQAVRFPVVFLDTPMQLPAARLVVLSADTGRSKAVIKDTMRQAKEYLPVFLYLAPPSHLPPPRIFEIRDRFALDEDAQLMLSRAKRVCIDADVQGRYMCRRRGKAGLRYSGAGSADRDRR